MDNPRCRGAALYRCMEYVRGILSQLPDVVVGEPPPPSSTPFNTAVAASVA